MALFNRLAGVFMRASSQGVDQVIITPKTILTIMHSHVPFQKNLCISILFLAPILCDKGMLKPIQNPWIKPMIKKFSEYVAPTPPSA